MKAGVESRNMLKRKIDRKLEAWLRDWQERSGPNVLMIEGIRGIGKSTSVRAFAEAHFEEVIWLDFREDPNAKKIIGSYSDIEYANYVLMAGYGTKMEEGKTIIVFDNIDYLGSVTIWSTLLLYLKDGRYPVIAISGEDVLQKQSARPASIDPDTGRRTRAKNTNQTESLSDPAVAAADAEGNGQTEPAAEIADQIPRTQQRITAKYIDDLRLTGEMIAPSEAEAELAAQIPVMKMQAMDFEEFLWAKGISEEQIDTVRNCYHKVKAVPENLHQIMMNMMCIYMLIGGLPEVVQGHIDRMTPMRSREIQQKYHQDVCAMIDEKFTKANSRNLIGILDSIPEHFQADPHNHKFQLKRVELGGTNRKFERCIRWLESAGYIHKCINLTVPVIRDDTRIDSQYAAYLPDIGWYVSRLPESMQFEILRGDLKKNDYAVLNCLIADFMIKAGQDMYYYHRRSGLTIDFLILDPEHETASILIEVAHYGNSKAVRTLLDTEPGASVSRAIVFTQGNVQTDGRRQLLPWYMGYFIFEK